MYGTLRETQPLFHGPKNNLASPGPVSLITEGSRKKSLPLFFAKSTFDNKINILKHKPITQFNSIEQKPKIAITVFLSQFLVIKHSEMVISIFRNSTLS